MVRSFVKARRRLPRRLRHSRDLTVVRQLAQADAADAELAIDRARTPAAVAPSIGLCFVFRWARLLDALRCLGHQSSLSFSFASSASASGSLPACGSADV